MNQNQTPALKFVPSGPDQVRFELQLSERFILVGEYIEGVLRGVTLMEKRGQSAAHRKEK